MGSIRKLKTKDMFSFARVIKHLDLKYEIQEIAKKADKIADVWDSGFDLVYTIFERAAEEEAEQEIYAWLAPILGITEEELAEMELNPLIELLREFTKVNDLTHFFKSAAALMK